MWALERRRWLSISAQTLTSEANKKGLKFRYVHVNCREFRGALQPILHRAITVFRPNFPARGYGAEEILATLMQVLDEEEATMILTLDEFDSLIEKEGSDAVYKLTRLQEMRQGKPQRLSFIFIMRDLKPTEGLDESARSTLQRSIIRLERYGKTQLIDILSDRVSWRLSWVRSPRTWWIWLQSWRIRRRATQGLALNCFGELANTPMQGMLGA